jgi:hypothetical protein
MTKSISRKHYTNKNKNVRVFLTLVTNDTAKILKESKNKLSIAFVLFGCNVRYVQIRKYINDNMCHIQGSHFGTTNVTKLSIAVRTFPQKDKWSCNYYLVPNSTE